METRYATVVPKPWVATRKWVAKPCHVGRQPVPPKKIFTQQRVATIEIVVHWVAKKPEKFKWVSGQKSVGTIVMQHIFCRTDCLRSSRDQQFARGKAIFFLFVFFCLSSAFGQFSRSVGPDERSTPRKNSTN
jgi:hypothetical protein